MIKRSVLLLFIIAAAGGAVWALFHFGGLKWQPVAQSGNEIPGITNAATSITWADAIEKIKAARSDDVANVALEIPPELKHYSDRHWFLATQVAEVAEHNVQSCQDYVDLAGMIERGEIVPVPSVTDTYVLFGVGARADEKVFTRFEGDHTIELYNEAQLNDAYKRLDDNRTKLQSEISTLKAQAGTLKKRDRAKQTELQKQISSRELELKSTAEEKALLDKFYGQHDSRQKLLRDYQSLLTLAKNFNGRSYDLNSGSDRQALKVNMLSSLRPQALKVLEEVASAYHRQFNRPLPISSLVRPEEYQHVLRRVNRNAVLIDTPPHSTGLAFDIDYRYMSAAEQNFVMSELARMKKEGRTEVIRERNANYHVFAFLNGARPNDELITASLDKASAPIPQTHHASNKPANVKSKAKKAKAQRPRANTRARKHRR